MRPVQHPRPYCRDHEVPCRYDEMEVQEVQRRCWRLYRERVSRPPNADGPYYIIHLYSGRRRAGDFQEWMERLLEERHWQGVRVISISIDPSMNIHCNKLWKFLMDIILQRRCLGLVLGLPCETWSRSSARHHRIIRRTAPQFEDHDLFVMAINCGALMASAARSFYSFELELSFF